MMASSKSNLKKDKALAFKHKSGRYLLIKFKKKEINRFTNTILILKNIKNTLINSLLAAKYSKAARF